MSWLPWSMDVGELLAVAIAMSGLLGVLLRIAWAISQFAERTHAVQRMLSELLRLTVRRVDEHADRLDQHAERIAAQEAHARRRG